MLDIFASLPRHLSPRCRIAEQFRDRRRHFVPIGGESAVVTVADQFRRAR